MYCNRSLLTALNAAHKEKNPLEEVKNRLEPLDRAPTQHLPRNSESQPTPKPVSSTSIPSFATPISRPAYVDVPSSAMKGVILTSTGETLATPSQVELVNLFKCSPKVGLNFAKIFDFEGSDHDEMSPRERRDEEEDVNNPPPSPSSRKTREKEQKKERDEPIQPSISTSSSSELSTTTTSQASAGAAPTRIRRPSIRNSTSLTHNRAGTISTLPTTISSSSAQPKPLAHPHLRPSKSNSNLSSNPSTLIRATTMPDGSTLQDHHRPAPEYNFADEENLPSPFLKKNDKSAAKVVGALAPMINPRANAPSAFTSTSTATSTSASRKKRPRNALLLRAVAAANNVG